MLADLGRRLRFEPDDVGYILPFEEVVEALGRVSETDLGLQRVPLDSIVGTVDRTKDFDRAFRPTSPRLRARWQRIAEAQRRGESFPPVSLYRIGELHFVRDGHHRVSVARSLGREDIDAYVTEVHTEVGPGSDVRVSDLPIKGHERLFRERVPLDPERRARVRPSDPWDYGTLAEGVEAWGFRAMQGRRTFMNRVEVARLWFDEDYAPVTDMLASAGLVERGETETDAYMRIVTERYLLLRTHDWSGEVLERLRSAGGGAARLRAGAAPSARPIPEPPRYSAARLPTDSPPPVAVVVPVPAPAAAPALRGSRSDDAVRLRPPLGSNSLICAVSRTSSTSLPALALLSASRRATTCVDPPPLWPGSSPRPESSASAASSSDSVALASTSK
jgi:hypothetical protein